jgi:hypothetical protein
MVGATGFLIAPTMRHRLVEHDNIDIEVVHYAGLMAGIALLPLALSLGIDHFNVFAHLFGEFAGAAAGILFFAAAICCWYLFAYAVRPSRKKAMKHERHIERRAPLVDRVDHMLTEARVVLPGAQALLGFQLSVVLMRSFEALPDSYKLAHAIALGLVAFSVILLMAPAAIHRIGFGGEETEEFYHLGSRFVVAATMPLATGIAVDVFVATGKATSNDGIGFLFAAISLMLLVALWYALPLWIRVRRHPHGRR